MNEKTNFLIFIVILVIIFAVCGFSDFSILNDNFSPKKKKQISGNKIPSSSYVRSRINPVYDSISVGTIKETTSGQSSKTEELVKEIVERLLKTKFIKIRPNFLKNPETNRNLELDLYSDKLKLAFEYNGEQHYIFPNNYHKTQEDHIKSIRRDEFKKERCEIMGIKLISIPYTKKDNLEEYIVNALREEGYPLK